MSEKDKVKGFTKVSRNIPNQVIYWMVIGAFEGGSNYWLHSADYAGSGADLLASIQKKNNVVWWGHEELYDSTMKMRVCYDDPKLGEGNAKGKKVITWADLQKGIKVMAKKYPKHFADATAENDCGDSITADIFMQCVILGECVYG